MTETRDTDSLARTLRDRCTGWAETVATVAVAPTLLARSARSRAGRLAELVVFAALLCGLLAVAAPVLQTWPVAASLAWFAWVAGGLAWLTLLGSAAARRAAGVRC